MKSARVAFLEAVASCEELISGVELVDQPVAVGGDPNVIQRNNGRRFMRNGVAIALFAAFEEFVWQRTLEVSRYLSSCALPRMQFPGSLRELVEVHAAEIVASAAKGGDRRNILNHSYGEIAAAWGDLSSAWVVPHCAFVWKGSNAGAEDVLRPLKGLEVVERWADLSGVLSMFGPNQKIPTQSVFEAIAGMRHNSAHNAAFNAPLIELRTTPANLKAIAFGFDALLSSAAYAVGHAEPAPGKGRSAISMVRFEDRSRDQWAQVSGPWKAGERAFRIRATADLASAAAQLVASGQVVVAVRRLHTGDIDVMDWWPPV